MTSSHRSPFPQGQDEESEPKWLERLYSLNAVISALEEPLVGNLFYEHKQEDFANSPPNPVFRVKRDRLRAVAARSQRILEVGVNGCHSAYLVLSANPRLEYHGVDICDHTYVEPAVEWLKGEFPGRVFFSAGNSLDVLPALAKRGMTFDAFHIDGAKVNYYDDLVNASSIVSQGGAIAVVDDAETMAARVALWSLTALGVVKTIPEFPSMSSADPNRHQIKSIVLTAPGKRKLLKMYSHALNLARRAKALRWTDTEWARVRRGDGSPA
jgi:predicted O-methyltransferase YrrM